MRLRRGFGRKVANRRVVRGTPAPAPTPTPSDPSYVGPQLGAQASPTSYPPAPILSTKAYHPVGAKLRVRVASTYADLVAGTSLLIDDASFTLTGNAATNQAGLAAILAGISSGKTFIDVRVEESPTVFSERSNPIMHGSASVPAPQASVDFNVYSTLHLSAGISFAEPVYLTLLGDDQISFELVGAQPGTTFNLRWMDNGTKDYTAYDDFDLDRVYDLILRRRSLADVSADTASTTTLLDYDTVPAAFTFTDVGGVARSSVNTSNTITVGDVASGYVGSGTVTGGEYQKNGGAWSTSPFSWTLGDTFKVRGTASASYSGVTNVVLALGATSDTYTITAEADPASVAPTFHAITVNSHGFGSGTSPHSVALKAGINLLFFASSYLAVASVSVPGCTVTAVDATSGNSGCSCWKVVAPSDGTYTATASAANFTDVYCAAVNLANAGASASEIDKKDFTFGSTPALVGNGTTKPADGIVLVFSLDQGSAEFGFNNVTEVQRVDTPNGCILGTLAASGTPSIDSTACSAIAVAWGV